MTDDREAAWVELYLFRARAEAEQHALVLVAMGIACRLEPRGGGVALTVARADADRARRQLQRYAQENRRPVRSSFAMRSFIEGLEGALAYAVLLFFLYGAPRREAFGQDWWAAGVAHAGLIASGEWWRTVTALGLHADLGHLAGNLAFGSLLGLLLSQPLGAGLAWLSILLAGTLGNVLSALLHSATHTAVGASTAVFGALGILAALAWRHRASVWRYGLRPWVPLAAGVMLLAYMGFGGERTDIGAHVAGFVAGGVIGAGLAVTAPRLPQGPGTQRAYAAAAFTLLALAWLLALRAHG